MNDSQKLAPQGFVWGYIYIALGLILGGIRIFTGLKILFHPEEEYPYLLANWIWIWGIFDLLSAIGLWGRWRWGLYLTYGMLLLSWILGCLVLIMPLVLEELSELSVVAFIVVMPLITATCALWLGYFYRRRRLFR